MKKILSILTFLLIPSLCLFSANILGTKTEKNGLTCEKIIHTVNGEKIYQNIIKLNNVLKIKFENVKGLTTKNNKIYPGLSIKVLSPDGNQVVSAENTLSKYSQSGLPKIFASGITATIGTGPPMKEGKTYKAELKLFDTKGSGKIYYKTNFKIKSINKRENIPTGKIVPSGTSNKSVLLLVDSSASMSEELEGKTRMAVAKEAISSVLSEIPKNLPLGLRVYGYGIDRDKTDKENCLDTQLLIPIGENTKNKITQKIYELSPQGYTPIAYSLSKAPQDFFNHKGKRFIILVSDAKETCGGNPASKITDLKKQGFKVIVHTIGFDVDDETKQQLKAISDASGGIYLDANNAQELSNSLRTVTKKIRKKIDYKEKGSIEPGSGFTNAALVQARQTYSHNIIAGEEHFFKIPVKKGKKILATVTMKRKEQGASWDVSKNIWVQSQIVDKQERKYHFDPSAFVYTVNLYDPDRMLLDGGPDQKTLIRWDQTSPKSTRVEGKMPFPGEAYLSIGLNWKYSNPDKDKLLGSKDEENFSEIRKNANPVAYYTIKFRKIN